MQVEGSLETKVVDVGEELLRIREELLLPGVARPAYALSELVLAGILPGEAVSLVPVHIDDHNVDRDVE